MKLLLLLYLKGSKIHLQIGRSTRLDLRNTLIFLLKMFDQRASQLLSQLSARLTSNLFSRLEEASF